MTKLTRALVLTSLLLSPFRMPACHCDPPHPGFFQNIQESEIICLATCIWSGHIEAGNEQSTQAARFLVFDPFISGSHQSGDTIFLIGQDGLNCGEDLTGFLPGDSMFLVLYEAGDYGFGPDTFYLEGACGKHYLELENGQNSGLRIEEIKTRIEYLLRIGDDPDYLFFMPFRTLLVRNEDQMIRSLRTDSIHIDGEARYYFNPVIRMDPLGSGCITPSGTSWAGNGVLIRPNGDHIFFNKQGDSILIRTLASMGTSWTCFESDEYRIRASISAHDTSSFMGLVDSVKTIVFEVNDSKGQGLEHALNDMSLIFSKNFGVRRMLNFYHFPDIKEMGYGWIEESLGEQDIVGMDDPEAGLQNFGWKEIFGFASGDEMHILEEQYTIRANQTHQSESRTTRKTIWKVLDAAYSYDAFAFTMERREHLEEIVDATRRVSYTHDTISQSYGPQLLLDALPGVPVFIDFEAYSAFMQDGERIAKIIDPTAVIYKLEGDTCWYNGIYCGCFTKNTYYRGLGGPFGSCTGGLDAYTEYSKELVYHAMSREEAWGTPFTFTGVDKRTNDPHLTIYPNPASDHISITCSRQIEYLRIIDSSGRPLKAVPVQQSEVRIALEDLEPGMYFIDCRTEAGSFTRKFLVR